MNKFQTFKYFRCWKRVVDANHWKWVKDRLVPEAVMDLSQHHMEVWRIARDLARQYPRAVVADDLRHACHVYALGSDISSKKLDNRQFDRLLLLWGDERHNRGLLVDPVNVQAQKLWSNPVLAKKDSLIRTIKGLAADEYISAITNDVWGTIYWEDLDTDSLVGLLQKIKARNPAMPVGQPF